MKLTLRQSPFVVFALLGVFLALFLSLTTGRALAHNEFVSSSPADGDVLSEAPQYWSVTFTKDVPLSSASGEIVTQDGVRIPLVVAGSGESANIVLYSLPTDLTGTSTARWKLVSEDGHVVQGRVEFTITNSTVTSVDSPSSSESSVQSSQTSGDESATVSTSSITSPAPEVVRWGVRYFEFASLIVIGGLIFVERLLAAGTLTTQRGIVFTKVGAISLAASPALQNLFFVGDRDNRSVFGALPHFFSTFDTTLGSMLIIQSVVGLALIYALITRPVGVADGISSRLVIALFFLYLIAVAFSGHSRTMAWPLLGIPADVVHTAAASIWLGGLAVIAFVIAPSVSVDALISTYRNFGFYAKYAVIAIIASGVIQTLRLHGDIASLFTESHGRILLLKILVVAAMLKIADINRHRMLRRITPDASVATRRISVVLRASATEVVVGAVVIAITASLVTAPLS